MVIHFYLRYHSVAGQNFFIQGSTPALGNGDAAQAVAMQWYNSEYWYIKVDTGETALSAPVTYSYFLQDADGLLSNEATVDRTLDLSLLKGPELQVYDTWNYGGEFQNAFYTQPFAEILLKRKPVKIKAATVKNATHTLQVKWPLLGENETLMVIGNTEALSNWNGQKPVLLSPDGVWYTTRLNLTGANFPIEYKYGVWNTKEGKLVKLEEGPNRQLEADATLPTVVHDGFAWLPNATFKGAGVAIPVFSMRTKNGFGTGEFSDIITLTDWAKQVGMKLIQILPVNDTTSSNTWHDSYPYSAVSVFALHPLYINLDKVAGKTGADIIKPYKKKQKQVNDLPYLDYETVMSNKRKAVAELYELMKKDWLADAEYAAFFDLNRHWLVPYAAFCYLRDENKTADFTQWKKLSQYNEAEAESLLSPKNKAYDKVAIHLFIQYHLHLQLVEAVQYAHKNGVVLKGDIAIGVNRYSCDTWQNPDLYNMDQQAGAPPDAFAVKGQNWSFPTYNWERMKENDYKWWRQRFNQMSYYFDAFRIDHILGFFRIWSVPTEQVEGIMGKFVPCIPVSRTEFEERGIYFDHNRYCQPFINDSVVSELFKEKADWIKETFLEDGGQQYLLKEEYNTQRKIEKWFAGQMEVESWVKDKLFDLVSNVILFEEGGSNGTQFHFRFAMDATINYRNLDGHTQWQLKELYNNYFFERQDEFWRKEALKKLPALKEATNMLICGEDLGLVPNSVPGVMKDLGILSLEIQRMPKDPKTLFFHPANAPYLSVVTPSTHDMSTIRGWWEEDRQQTQQFYNSELGNWGIAPWYCEDWVNRQIVNQHVYSPAMWSIFQIQDLMGMDGKLRKQNPQEERINRPDNPNHYWRYRMHLSIEDLMKETTFNDSLKALLKDSGRS